MGLSKPIAFLIFNRPDTTEKVFETIRLAKPSKLLVVADGPRPDRPGEAEKCAATRAIIDRVDWECDVLKNYSEINLGCGKRVSSGLDWVFNTVEEAIILEDDTLPNASFFEFSSQLLDHFRFNKRVMAIGGTNLLKNWKADEQDYHFSYHGSIWGWASWSRAWKLYDFSLKAWQQKEIQQLIRQVSLEPKYFNARKRLFEESIVNKVDTWDYQWLFTRLANQGLTILPAKNLVSNIGFGINATHTTNEDSKFANLPTYSINYPLNHSQPVEFDQMYERKILEFIYKRDKIASLKSIIAKLISH
ncbi:MAG: glycosyltransferase family 2 protein [Gloeotrichia echinulata GP01]